MNKKQSIIKRAIIRLDHIRLKLMALFIIIIISNSVVLGFQQVHTLTNTIEQEALVKAQSDLQMSYAYIDAHLQGSWGIKENKLYKGDTLINENFDLVDQIGVLTNGNTVTLFMNDTRIATNVLAEDGTRAIGSKVSEIVATEVLVKGQHYYGIANVVGNSYQAAYMPLKDEQGTAIGIYYVGAPDNNERIQAAIDSIILENVVQSLLLIAASFIVMYLLTNPMISRIKRVDSIMQSVASGDLTVQGADTRSNDETGSLLKSTNLMLADLKTMIQTVSVASNHLSSSSIELAASTEQSSESAEHIGQEMQQTTLEAEDQLDSITTINQSIKDITTGMEQTSSSIQELTNSSAEASLNANNGYEIVLDAIAQMTQIHHAVEEVDRDMLALNDKAAEVEQIISIITDIANQTQLLALNASIEAARAGEEGRGFAVVANEVKKLSVQSHHSAELIKSLIREMKTQSQKSITSLTESAQVIHSGIQQVNASGQAFQQIVASVEELASQHQEVSAIVQEVTATTEEMNNHMQQILQNTNDTVARTQTVSAEIEEQVSSMEDIHALTSSLEDQANELEALIGKFKC